MKTSSLLSLSFLSVSLLACAANEDARDQRPGGGGGKADGAGTLSAHARTVARCRATLDANESVDLFATVERFRTFHECLEGANAVSADVIDTLTSLDYNATEPFEQYELNAGTLCKTLGGISDPDYSLAVELSCRGKRSNHLAELIDAYVMFGFEYDQPAYTRNEDLFEACYGPYHGAMNAATDSGQGLQAETALATCLDTETKAIAADSIVPALIAHGKTEAQAKAAITHAFKVSKDSTTAACTIIAAAQGEANNSTMGPIYMAGCMSDAAAMMAELLFEMSESSES